MHLLLSLYDAPVPAHGAVAALKRAGVADRDIAVVPARAVSAKERPASAPSVRGHDASRLSLPADPGELAKSLAGLGITQEDAQTCGEGVRRGAILLVVRVPTLHAASARSEMDRFCAVSLATHRARWDRDPALRYGWSATQAPDVVGPLAPEK